MNLLSSKGLTPLSGRGDNYPDTGGDVYPHLCPAMPGGEIPPVNAEATRQFLDIFSGFRVMPWIGGVLGKNAHPDKEDWRRNFVTSAIDLLKNYPEFAGVHLNIEPCPSGHLGFLRLLDELRAALPDGEILSVAAYPPPIIWQPSEEVHWNEAYYREVSRRADQLVVMMYDTGVRLRMVYRGKVKRLSAGAAAEIEHRR